MYRLAYRNTNLVRRSAQATVPQGTGGGANPELFKLLFRGAGDSANALKAPVMVPLQRSDTTGTPQNLSYHMSASLRVRREREAAILRSYRCRP